MDTASDASLPWWKRLSRYHWFVFIVATLAWMFDCLDQQLFILARENAIKTLVPQGDSVKYGGWATAIFVAGWALGGLLFGSIGDRIGRAKTLALTVLIYSVCTGLSAFSRNFTEFAIYRAITGLGVGGVFGLAVALVADSLPDFARPKALGLLQALSAVGNVGAGLCAMAVSGSDPAVSWKYLFWIGSIPAFLCIFIMLRLKEPEKWVQAKARSLTDATKSMGSYRSLLGDHRWRSSAVFGMLLCVAGVVGLWGVGFFSPSLTTPAIKASLQEAVARGEMTAAEIGQKTQWWTAMNLIVQNIGAFFGMICMSKLAQAIGRKKAFVFGFLGAMGATILFYRCFQTRADIWMSAVMGFFQLALFAGFAIYLPELFPTRLRSTGTSFCYNVGRFIAATGPVTLGTLKEYLQKSHGSASLDAFRDAACWLSGIYLLGLLVLPFLPETKGRPLPEDG